jgi:hypothetical protein
VQVQAVAATERPLKKVDEQTFDLPKGSKIKVWLSQCLAQHCCGSSVLHVGLVYSMHVSAATTEQQACWQATYSNSLPTAGNLCSSTAALWHVCM